MHASLSSYRKKIQRLQYALLNVLVQLSFAVSEKRKIVSCAPPRNEHVRSDSGARLKSAHALLLSWQRLRDVQVRAVRARVYTYVFVRMLVLSDVCLCGCVCDFARI